MAATPQQRAKMQNTAVETALLDEESVPIIGADESETEPQIASSLPEPAGYKLLIALPKPKEKSEGGIFKPHEAMQIEEVATVVGFVLKVGPDAYMDPKRFPNGPYCKEGDWVVFRAFSGTRIKIYGQEFRLLNDDSVEAVVEDPQGVERA